MTHVRHAGDVDMVQVSLGPCFLISFLTIFLIVLSVATIVRLILTSNASWDTIQQ